MKRAFGQTAGRIPAGKLPAKAWQRGANGYISEQIPERMNLGRVLPHNLISLCGKAAAGCNLPVGIIDMKGDPGKFKDSEPIFMAAWQIALLSNSNNNAPAAYSNSPDFAVAWYSAINKLNILIANSDEYKATAKDLVKNDGVGREWKLPKPVGDGKKSP